MDTPNVQSITDELDRINNAISIAEMIEFEMHWPQLGEAIKANMAAMGMPDLTHFLKPIIEASYSVGVKAGIQGLIEYFVEEYRIQLGRRHV